MGIEGVFWYVGVMAIWKINALATFGFFCGLVQFRDIQRPQRLWKCIRFFGSVFLIYIISQGNSLQFLSMFLPNLTILLSCFDRWILNNTASLRILTWCKDICLSSYVSVFPGFEKSYVHTYHRFPSLFPPPSPILFSHWTVIQILRESKAPAHYVAPFPSSLLLHPAVYNLHTHVSRHRHPPAHSHQYTALHRTAILCTYFRAYRHRVHKLHCIFLTAIGRLM